MSAEATTASSAASVLATSGVAFGYDGAPVVSGLDIAVAAGQILVVLGPNGAGKTTTLLGLAGELEAIEGNVWYRGEPTTSPLHRRAKHGLSFVTEERSVFMELTAAENLRVGRCDRHMALELFPELVPLLDRRAGNLSGGEQQILTLARALARRPTALLADELSMGLAPLIVQRLLRAVRRAADDGVAIVLVEQHVRQALRVADRALVLQHGNVVFHGTAAGALVDIDTIEASYLATPASEPTGDETSVS